ncbi:hypothetical protein U879_15260 [Defluviimonas sp. 20V17]|uniref:2-hydroxyacid dehydrogenase n=1 Tax=Allgaiera indica TaxID=765699 RepID=A0AAN4ZZ68_9RHOB|nr:NAD(P)-dependent oxidoreductase [Allgaiera indica]KDB02822.1 hypothetical protein U879_15260 [Defluviimonas sp. 20V17]GHE01262.1 2-hydroxyacid dehydrogenase [Allgaiera indica]SDW83662.1 D-3-phosphoglycerate dehydrogenase [Allgaiera indica]
MTRVLLTEPIHPDAEALLRDAGCEILREGPPGEADALIARIKRLPAEQMCAGRLRHVAKHGVGVDNIDLAAARAAGILVTNTPGANAASVAEHALALIFALAKALPAMERAARAGQTGLGRARVVDLAGRRLLVVGFGASGRRLAALAAAVGMRVTVLSRSLSGAVSPEGYAVARDLRAALAAADVLSLHCPLTEATRGMIGARELAALPPGAFVINTARGGLIDEDALARAGHLGGVALDVTETEPLPRDSPLLDLPNCILTPHSAALSDGAFRQMGLMAAQNVLDALAGRVDPAHVVVRGG